MARRFNAPAVGPELPIRALSPTYKRPIKDLVDKAQSWVEALNINPEMLNAWSSQAPAGKPLLVWCLEEGHVSVSEYMLWATEHFGLAVLASAFFESGELSLDTLARERASGLWQPWCYPVNTWDGHMIVACVEPPEERDAHLVFVLADPRAMNDAWQAAEAAAAPAAPVVMAPEFDVAPAEDLALVDAPVELPSEDHPPVAAPPPPPAPSTRPAPTLKPVAPPALAEASDSAEAPATEVPEISFAPPKKPIRSLEELKAELEHNGSDDESDAPSEAAPAEEPIIDAPAGIDINRTIIYRLQLDNLTLGPAPKTDPPPAPLDRSVPLDEDAAPAESVDPDNESSPSVHVMATEQHTMSTESIVLTSPLDEDEAEPSIQQMNDNATVFDSPPDLSPPTVIRHLPSLSAHARLDLPASESAALTKAFAHINKAYLYACILRVSGTAAKLHKTDSNLRADPAKVTVDLGLPTFLRIVQKTGMPYHGYLVDSPAHRAFITSMGLNDLPGCVTAVPLKLGERLWGILLAMGREDLQTLENLGMVEDTAEQLVRALSMTWSKVA